MAGATSWIVACAKCGLRWKRPEPMSPISEYERQTVESRPCPGCGARFPAAKSGPPYTDSAFVEQPDPRPYAQPTLQPGFDSKPGFLVFAAIQFHDDPSPGVDDMNRHSIAGCLALGLLGGLIAGNRLNGRLIGRPADPVPPGEAVLPRDWKSYACGGGARPAGGSECGGAGRESAARPGLKTSIRDSGRVS